MFLSPRSKLVATRLRDHENTLLPDIAKAFEGSVVGCTGEVKFFDALIKKLGTYLENLSIPGLAVRARIGRIHQKPIVRYSGGSCELGDLLVVVKYRLLDDSVEAKSIVYQVKMASSGSGKCSIDAKQLELLHHWPTFSFGRAADGSPVDHTIEPATLEFGSYMLEPRGATKQASGPYGSVPNAHAVAAHSGKSVPIRPISYTRGDVRGFFSHLVFESGEHHSNAAVAALVDAVYRYVGLEPDPPREFDGFAAEREDATLFAILEVTVVKGEELEVGPRGSPSEPLELEPSLHTETRIWRPTTEWDAIELELAQEARTRKQKVERLRATQYEMFKKHAKQHKIEIRHRH